MSIAHLLTVVPVSDIDRSTDWYERFFGTSYTNNPMPTLVEWQVVDGGWVQVHLDPERAGHTLFNIAVDDLDAHRATLAERGLIADEITEAGKDVRLSTIADPDGNTITLIGSFRVDY